MTTNYGIIMDPYVAKQLDKIAAIFQFDTSIIAPVSIETVQESDDCTIHATNNVVTDNPAVINVKQNGHKLSTNNTGTLNYKNHDTNGERQYSVVNKNNGKLFKKAESIEREMTPNRENKILRRRSFADHKSNDHLRKRHSLNTTMIKVLEHPSAFPSILRMPMSQSQIDLGPQSPTTLQQRDDYKSGLRRRESFGSTISSSNRKDREGSYSSASVMSLNRRNSFGSTTLPNRRGSISSAISRTDSLDAKQNFAKINNQIENNRRQSFGVSLYLRPDSSGHTNLIRRDSFGSQGLWKDSFGNNGTLNNRNSALRDYVNKPIDNNQSHDQVDCPALLNNQMPKKEMNSILRKDSVKSSPNKHVSYFDLKTDHSIDNLAHKLTKANLNKHVTILEKNLKNELLGKKLCFDNDKLSDSNSSSGKDDRYHQQASRRISIDSLEMRKNSWDRSRRGSSSSSPEHFYSSWKDNKEVNAQNDNRPRFIAVTALEDVQAVRCAEFHPNGKVYAVGSNSKTFRICEYPSLSEIREEHTTYQPTVLFKRTKHHKGSIYCMAWSPQGDLVATGSNDKTVKLMRYNDVQKQLEGKEIELTMHDGTVRDLCFLEDSTNKTSLLISAGAGDCKIYVTDCATATPFQALSGHGGHILSLYNWGGAMFVSGSHDKSVRFWDLRTRGCVNTVTPATVPGSRQGSPVASVCVDPSGRLLVSGHEDSSCVLYDIRGNRPIQCFKPHTSDVRSIRFSPSAYYLLTGGYDNKLVLTDLQGDLTMPLPSVIVAQHNDKVISGRWHPNDFSFLSTSADKMATLWALPPI